MNGLESIKLAATYSPGDEAPVPSAHGCFTSVFGMGTGVAAPPWPPEKSPTGSAKFVRPSGRPRDGNGNMVKPHGTLVPVG